MPCLSVRRPSCLWRPSGCLPVRRPSGLWRPSCHLPVWRPLCLSFVEFEIALTNLRDFLDHSRLIIRASSFAFGSSRSFASHHAHLDHRDPSRLILRVSSFAFGSSRSLTPHHSHSDHRDPSRLIVRIRIIAIPRASSFAFGSSRSFAPLHRRGFIRRPSSWACPSFNSVSAGRTSREAVGALPFSVRLPEHRCFCGFTFPFDSTSSSTVCLSIAAFVASPSSSTLGPSRGCQFFAAFVASLSPFGVWPLITESQFGSRSRRDVEVRLRPSRAARPCWTLFLSFLFPSRRRWTGPSLAATDKSGGDDAGRGRGKAPGVVRSKASGR